LVKISLINRHIASLRLNTTTFNFLPTYPPSGV
jgi:hypothetical protein